jgi:starch phosphorylase
LYRGDPYFVTADFRHYRLKHLEVDSAYADSEGWTRKSILNVARMGRFSSDATIRRYARDIWRVPTGTR